jgi:hypothetical protein
VDHDHAPRLVALVGERKLEVVEGADAVQLGAQQVHAGG